MNISSILDNLGGSLANLTCLDIKYISTPWSEPFNEATRNFCLDPDVDKTGDSLSTLLRCLSKRLQEVKLDYKAITPAVFQSQNDQYLLGELGRLAISP